MRTTFDEVRIFGFGRFTDLTLELGRGLNLLVGPNEAGKSTIFSFIRAVLYGFDRRASASRLEPRSGGAFGGELLVSTGAHAFVVARSGSRRRVEGELALRELDGTPLPERALASALGQVNRELFCQVFSLTLEELRDFEALTTESEVADALFAAGAQGAQRVPATLAHLEGLAGALWSPRAQKKPLNLELARLEETRVRLAQVAQKPEAWFEALRAREALQASELALREALGAARERLARDEALLRALPAVREALSLEAGPPAAPVDPASLTRVELLEPRARELHRAEEALRATVTSLERRAEALRRGTAGRVGLEETRVALERWRAAAPASRALAARQLGLAERRQSVDQRAKRALGREVHGGLQGLDVGAARLAELQALRERELALSAERGRAEEAVHALGSELERLRRARSLLERPAPVASTAELEEQALAAQRVLELSRELEERALRERAVRERLDGALPLQPPAPGLFTGATAWLLALGLWSAAGLAGRLAPPWVAAGLVALAATGSLLCALLHRRAVAAAARAREAFELQRAEQRRVRSSLEAEALGLAAERERLASLRGEARRLARVESADEARVLLGQLSGWRREAEEFERCGREAAQLGAALQALEVRKAEASRRVASAYAELDATQTEVDARTTSLGFSAGLRAQQAIDLLTEAGRLQDEELALSREEASWQRDARLVEEARAALGACAQGLSLACAGPVDVVAERVAGLLALDARERAELAEASIRLEETRASLERTGAELTTVRAQLALELSAARAADAAALRELVSAGQRARARAERRAQLEVQVRLLCAGGLEQIGAELEERGELESGLAQRRLALAGLEARLSQTSVQLGEVKERLVTLESETLAASLRAEDAAGAGRSARLAQACAVASLAAALLQRSRQRFEAQHQPRVVRRAGELFEALTSRRFASLHVDPAARTLSVRDAQGAAWPLAQLSRGTRELLLLAFRLAVVEDFGQTRVQLPLILDDVLVNVDPDRAWRLVQVLDELSKRHQIIAMTCHPGIRGLFQAVEAKIIAVRQQTQLSLLEE